MGFSQKIQDTHDFSRLKKWVTLLLRLTFKPERRAKPKARQPEVIECYLYSPWQCSGNIVFDVLAFRLIAPGAKFLPVYEGIEHVR
jgi:hypothetical protein